MSCFTAILAILIKSFSVVVATISVIAIIVYSLRECWKHIFVHEEKEPDEYEEKWYGKDPKTDEDTSIRPFKVDVPDAVLEDLKHRLERTRFEDPLVDSKFLYGFNPNYLKKVVDYWRKDYDWRAQETKLNQYQHFKTRIEGIDIHFLHAKPELPADSKLKVLPLMLIHGWPGSVVEFYKIIPKLTTPTPGRNFVFEVICPSIPGYGFSESPHKQGFNIRAAARVFVTLMSRIGFPKFYVQGGDWGSIISSCMARYYPSRISGVHLNLVTGNFPLWDGIKFLFFLCFPFVLKKEERMTARLAKKFYKNMFEEMGYAHIQATKPDTVGCAITDTPAGLAAYILEKFSSWTNPEYVELEDGGITKKYSLDDLLTNVMVYWVNNNFTASVRLYKESFMPIFFRRYQKNPITVPAAVAVFPNEITTVPRPCLSQQITNLVSYNIMPQGGHFPAFEEPELLANDVWNFVSIVEK